MMQFSFLPLLLLFHSATKVLGILPIHTVLQTADLRPAQEHLITQKNNNNAHNSLVSLRGGGEIVDIDLIPDAIGWCANLGAPAALIAGAVFATLIDSRKSLSPNKHDTRGVRVAKKLCRFLLVSSFGLEIISIFVTTVTGTMLLSHGDRSAGTEAGVAYHSPMGFLKHNLEFEYLTSRITFLQGLFNWLASVALQVAIPEEGEAESGRKMNLFISSCMTTTILFMLAFLNSHMTFYTNYAHMLQQYMAVAAKRYFGHWPPKPMTFVLIPSMIITSILGYQAFATPPALD